MSTISQVMNNKSPTRLSGNSGIRLSVDKNIPKWLSGTVITQQSTKIKEFQVITVTINISGNCKKVWIGFEVVTKYRKDLQVIASHEKYFVKVFFAWWLAITWKYFWYFVMTVLKSLFDYLFLPESLFGDLVYPESLFWWLFVFVISSSDSCMLYFNFNF